MLDRGRELEVVAEGCAETTDLSAVRQRIVSFYADPVAWLVVEAVEAAKRQTNHDVAATGTDVGVLSVSEYATSRTMRTIAATATRGRVAPLRFAGANPGSLAGLPCIVFGFRGPSLVLSMPPVAARSAAVSIVGAWLRTAGCQYVVLSEHTALSDEVHSVTSRIVRRLGSA